MADEITGNCQQTSNGRLLRGKGTEMVNNLSRKEPGCDCSPSSQRTRRERSNPDRSNKARTTKKVGRANDMVTGVANHTAFSVEGGVDRDEWGDVDSRPIKGWLLPHPADVHWREIQTENQPGQ